MNHESNADGVLGHKLIIGPNAELTRLMSHL